MEIKLSIVVTYYNSPLAMDRFLQSCSDVESKVLDSIEVVIVDDASRVPLDVQKISRDHGSLQIRPFRVLNDIPWNHRSARNIGVHESSGTWILALDIDTLPDIEMILEKIEILDTDAHKFYLLNRVEFGTKKPLPIHHDSFLITRSNYWKTGGFDENFAGMWGFGKTWFHDAKVILKHEILWDTFVVRFKEEDPLDSQTELPRKRTFGNILKVAATRLMQRLIGYPQRKVLDSRYAPVKLPPKSS